MARAMISDDLITSSAVVHAHPCRLKALTVLTDGSNDATVTIYDHASAASGTVLAKGILPAADRTGYMVFPGRGVAAMNGAYAELTTANCIVLYEPGNAA